MSPDPDASSRPALDRAYALPSSDVLDRLGVQPDQGLSDGEVAARRERFGPNRLREVRGKSAWRILFEQFTSALILILIAAELVALLFGHGAEAIAIAAVLVVNAAIGFLTEWRAVRAMDALRDLARATVRVRRSGEERTVDEADLVPGDIVVIEGGDRAPSDLRLVEANGMAVDEAPLTGESVPVAKRTDAVSEDASLADRTSMLHMGTVVTQGSGAGVVVATGMATELGRISELAESAEAAATPLQRRLDRLGRRLGVITVVTAVLVAVLGLLVGQDPAQMIETAIALGVAAIPEGLPVVATIALAHGMWRLARQRALINRLPAVETLGATRVIFTDKTGTLTENRMTLTRVVTSAGEHELDEEERSVDGAPASESAEALPPLLVRVLEAGVLCNNASTPSASDEGPDAAATDDVQGDPTEVALLNGARLAGVEREALLRHEPELREEPFDAERMLMATFHEDDGAVRIAVKGAPGAVLDLCTRVATDPDAHDVSGDRSSEEMSDALRTRWHERSEELARQGLRVLALAEKRADDESEDPYESLVLLGLVGLHDPPRPNVRWAIEACHRAGITVILATGDQAATALAIAEQTGIVEGDGADVVQGRELDRGGSDGDAEADVVERIRAARVFARVSPEQKLHLVEAFQAAGDTVAMTGDGINDAPALKTADIGVAMGVRGTDAARQVADMVLQDDAFETIVAAVQQGRVVFDNIRKAVLFMLCTNLAEVVAVTVASVLGAFSTLPLPLLPLQILYLNVLTDVFPALALAVGTGDPKVMDRPPRARGESVLTRDHWRAIVASAALIAVCVLTALALAHYLLDLEVAAAVTVSFLTLGFGKLWFTFVLRAPGSHPLDNDVVRNRYVWASLALCIPLLVAAVYLPGLSDVLRTAGPGAAGWALLLGMSLVPFAVGQAVRAAQRGRAAHAER